MNRQLLQSSNFKALNPQTLVENIKLGGLL